MNERRLLRRLDTRKLRGDSQFRRGRISAVSPSLQIHVLCLM